MITDYIEGDLLSPDNGEKAIAHGCNCQGAFGAGVAGQIAKQMPEVAEEYHDLIRGQRFYLGGCYPAYDRRSGKIVFHLGTQDKPGPDASARAIQLAFGNLGAVCKRHKIERVAIPRIGCGIGGLTWHAVVPAISNGLTLSQNTELEIVVYDFVPAS